MLKLNQTEQNGLLQISIDTIRSETSSTKPQRGTVNKRNDQKQLSCNK